MKLTPGLVEILRRTVAGLAGLVGGLALFIDAKGDRAKLAIPIVGLFLAGLIAHGSTLGPQLLARAIWWSNLGLGTILCVLGSSHERNVGVIMTLGCGVALLAIGRKGLAQATERAAYAPAAFRSSLLLLMVLALADAQTLGLFTILEYDTRNGPSGAFVLGAFATVFVVGFVGLYRIKIWGAVVNSAAALVLFALTLFRALSLSHDLETIIAILMGVQLLVSVPMLVAALRGKPLLSPPAKLRPALATLAIVTVMGVSLWFGVARH
jgi:hypothetical protein